jgi:hypothetical protein
LEEDTMRRKLIFALVVAGTSCNLRSPDETASPSRGTEVASIQSSIRVSGTVAAR